MKAITLLVLIFLPAMLHASQPRLTTITLPLWYPFSIDQVATKAAQCIRREFADKNQTRIFMVQDGKEMEYEPTKGEKDGRRDGDKPTN